METEFAISAKAAAPSLGLKLVKDRATVNDFVIERLEPLEPLIAN